MIKSRLSSKAQTVLPRAVRQHLGVGPGDEIAFEIVRAGEVVLRSASPDADDDPFASFTEWAEPADEVAFADLPIKRRE